MLQYVNNTSVLIHWPNFLHAVRVVKDELLDLAVLHQEDSAYHHEDRPDEEERGEDLVHGDAWGFLHARCMRVAWVSYRYGAGCAGSRAGQAWFYCWGRCASVHETGDIPYDCTPPAGAAKQRVAKGRGRHMLQRIYERRDAPSSWSTPGAMLGVFAV